MPLSAARSGSPEDRRDLTTEIGGSSDLRWAMAGYLLAVEPADVASIARALAAAVIIVEDYEDFRDLVRWLLRKVEAVAAQGIDVGSEIDRMAQLAEGPNGRKTFRSLRRNLALE